jgi:XTP/dITP diphosphohydrolase
MRNPNRMLLATSNPGKLREYREMAGNSAIGLDLLADFPKLAAFEESAPTFAENAAGKALHYSEFTDETVLAEDSGLVVPALGGEPGVYSARYAGEKATDADRIQKLLGAMKGKNGEERRARFVCVIALALQGRPVAVISEFVEGQLTLEPRGDCGFGYDPVFLYPGIGLTFGEISQYEKNYASHRGKAFRKVLELVTDLKPSATS